MKFLIKIFLSLIVILPLVSEAQTAPKFLVSWKAISYAPPEYLGKVFPTRATPIEIGFDLMDKNRLVNLSNFDILWTLDNEPMISGQGLKTFRFNARKFGGGTHNLRINILDYLGEGEDLEYSFKIPVKLPELVIDSHRSSNNFSLGSHLFRALPYFFNNTLYNLNFNWLIDNEEIKGESSNPNFLTLNLQSAGETLEQEIKVSARVQNRVNPLEIAGDELNIATR